jgi:hypothetical protein
MAEPGCETCSFRAKYDTNPKSLLGRIWRWHINFCPGWKKYMGTVPDEKRMELAKQYDIKKYM